MWGEILKDIVSQMIPVVILAITGLAIPLVKRKLTQAGIDLSIAEQNKIDQTAEKLIRVAEVAFTGPGRGKEKLAFVMKEATKELAGTAVGLARVNLEQQITALHSKIIKEPQQVAATVTEIARAALDAEASISEQTVDAMRGVQEVADEVKGQIAGAVKKLS